MKLADLRKLSIRKQFRIRFVLSNGMECVITQHGIAQVPALKGVPNFNLEQELDSIDDFLLEPAAVADVKHAPKPRSVSRAELAAMTEAPAPAAHDDHEEE